MTDLEITRLCAKTSGIDISEQEGVFIQADELLGIYTGARYDPLHDDVQAMALGKSDPWLFAIIVENWARERVAGRDADLNRMLCVAFAKMQAKP